MVGYRNKRYERFGKVSARLDDILNYIPSRLTALLISILMLSLEGFKNIFKYGSLHDSINAGYPIASIAGVCNISLGGDTSYFGQIKSKPYFGNGTKVIEHKHIKNALKELDDEVQKILLDWSIPLNEKDNLMLPILQQKRVLDQTLQDLRYL